MDSPSDEKLLQDYVAGDAASFELLVRRHTGELYQFAARLTGNSAAAEDVVQETFLKVHQAAESFDSLRKFKPWLFTIAANKARDYLRKQDRKRELPFEAYVSEEEGSKRFLELLSVDEADPTAELSLADRRRLVRKIIHDMPPKLKEVLILAYYHRFRYREIAEILGIGLGTVKSRVHMAIGHFAGLYQANVRDREEHQD